MWHIKVWCGNDEESCGGHKLPLLWDREQLRAQGRVWWGQVDLGLGMGGIREGFLQMGPGLGLLKSDLAEGR